MIVLSPPASGKSTFATNLGDPRLKDSDSIPGAVPVEWEGKDEGLPWWEAPNAVEVAKATSSAVLSAHGAAPGTLMLATGLIPSDYDNVPAEELIAVVPDASLHMQRARTRALEADPSKMSSWDDIVKVRNALLAYARGRKIVVVPTFDDAVRLWALALANPTQDDTPTLEAMVTEEVVEQEPPVFTSPIDAA